MHGPTHQERLSSVVFFSSFLFLSFFWLTFKVGGCLTGAMFCNSCLPSILKKLII